MKNFCTVSDINYLHLALSMHESLSKSDIEYTLYYFCVDEETFNFLSDYLFLKLFYQKYEGQLRNSLLTFVI